MLTSGSFEGKFSEIVLRKQCRRRHFYRYIIKFKVSYLNRATKLFSCQVLVVDKYAFILTANAAIDVTRDMSVCIGMLNLWYKRGM